IVTDEGWLHLAAVMDLYSRAVVGWAMAPHLRTELVIGALEMAICRRRAPRSRAPLRPRNAVHLVRVRSEAPRLRDPRLDGRGRHRVRQRCRGELLLDDQAGARSSTAVHHSGRGEERDLRVDRGLLQASTPSLNDRQREP